MGTGVNDLAKRLTATPGREAVLAGFLAFLLFFAGTGATPLIGRDEPRFAEAAREMLARGDLVVPTFGGVNRYDKPILVYWCTMASYALFGVNERAARLPSNLAGALTVLLLAWWARRRFGPGLGLLAGLLLAVTLTFHLEARACTADLVMLLPSVAALLALEHLVADDRSAPWVAFVFWVGMALALLAKGPVGPAFAIFTGLGLWALGRRWNRWEVGAMAVLVLAGWYRAGPEVLAIPLVWALVETLRSAHGRRAMGRLRWQWGVPLLVALTAPWAVAALRATDGEFFRVGVGKHVVARSMTALESHGGFPGFYLVTGLVAAFPLFAFMAPAVAGRWRALREDVTLRFLAAWLLGPLLMLELVETKLVHYWMLSYPAGALLVAAWLAAKPEPRPRFGRTGRVLLFLGGLPVAALGAGLALHFGIGRLLLPGAVAGVLLLAGLVAAAIPRDPRHGVAAAVVGTALFLTALLGWYLPILGTELVGPRAVRRLDEIRRPGERIVIYKARDDELFFYLPLDAINCRPKECLAAEIASGRPFLGVARLKDLKKFEKLHPGLPVKVAETVRGLDLGHGRWTEMALFRRAPAGHPAGGGPE
ncbi:MAG: phospholipid carrier-dependent glycosyltransferase [Acidobacteria bacterium]|nr:phospholipid carrier-dependent glycosyltransferase [Acidobacteriota bacterium]